MKRTIFFGLFLCLAIVSSGILAVTAPQQGGYHLLKKIPLGPAPGGGEYFDYLTFDPIQRHVYISHGTEVKVLDADTGTVIGAITGLKRCHGIALVNELGKGFISDGDAAAAVTFDMNTLKVTGQVKAAPDADAIIYDPASQHIFCFNGDSHSATVIDPKTAAVVGTIELGGVPENAVADGKGLIYNNNEEKNDVAVIDSSAQTVKARWPVAPAGGPTGIAMDHEHRRIFSAGRNPQNLVVMDADSGKVIQSFPISSGVDYVVFEPDTGRVFCSTREGMVHIFHEDSPDKFSLVETVKTEYGAKTMALDPKNHDIYVTTCDFGPAQAPAKDRPNPTRPAIPGTFHLLVYGR